MAAFPEKLTGRLPHYVFRDLLSVHSRYGLHTRRVTYRTLHTGGFSRFGTSTTAPITTGWSESCRAGFAPAERPCPLTRNPYSVKYVSVMHADLCFLLYSNGG